MILPVRPEEIDFCWPQVSPFLERAIEGTMPRTHDINDLKNACLRGDFVLWVYLDGRQLKSAVVTEIQQTPKIKFLNIPYVGGVEMTKWLGLVLETLEKYGMKNGCSYMTGGGRRGWCRVAGFKPLPGAFARAIPYGQGQQA